MKKIALISLLLFSLHVHAQIITTIAGNGIAIYSGDGGPATDAGITPLNACFDATGNMYVACNTAGRIRKISPDGIITTVAGTGTGGPGFGGDGGPASSAILNNPGSVAIDATGNIYICDDLNNRIRKVMTGTGIITTIAGTGTPGRSGDGGPATAALLSIPESIAFDAAGNLYIADYENSLIRKIDTAGIITTIAGSGTVYGGDGGPATAAGILYPRTVCIDGYNNIYFNEDYSHKIRKVDPAGIITTIAGRDSVGFSGDGGPATAAYINTRLITCDPTGNVYLSEYTNRIRMINKAGIINTIAGDGSRGFSGDGGAAVSAEFYFQEGLVTDTCGNLFVCDDGNYRIRKVSFNPECWPLKVNNPTNTNTFSIFPNPCNGILNVSVTTPVQETAILTVTDAIGNKIKEEREITNQRITLTLDVSPGIYFLSATTAQCIYYRKVIVQ